MKNRTLHFACISVLFWMSHSSNAARLCCTNLSLKAY
ncbi:hypothetical protein, partial [Acinetobacter baumannii]